MNFVFATCYSGGLSCFCFSAFPAKNWDVKKTCSVVGFWNIFVVPFGMVWTKVNEKVMRTAGFPITPTKMFLPKSKFLIIDVLLNHVLYQSVFVYSFYRFLNELFPNEKIFGSIQNKESNEQTSRNIVKDIIFFRAKLSFLSITCDFLISNQEHSRGLKTLKVKNLGINTLWHLYLFYKYFVDPEKVKNPAEMAKKN